MRPSIPWLTAGLLLVAVLSLIIRVSRNRALVAPAAIMEGEPNLMIWAWEIPEDLRTLDTTRAGVAFLSRELLLGAQPQVRLRREPLLLAPSTYLMAVVRIETAPEFDTANADLVGLAEQILAATQIPGIRALQIDFDSRASERPFYVALLKEVQSGLPGNVPLSITALASWCGETSWLGPLQVDEAVPMLFRMGGPAGTRAMAPRSFTSIREPHRAGSVGLATDEFWPKVDSQQRLYVFKPGSWSHEDLALINRGEYRQLQQTSLTRSKE